MSTNARTTGSSAAILARQLSVTSRAEHSFVRRSAINSIAVNLCSAFDVFCVFMGISGDTVRRSRQRVKAVAQWQVSSNAHSGDIAPARRGAHSGGAGFDYRADDLFRAAAARMSVLKAPSSISSPSWISIARLTLPSRLELNSPLGSLSEAPLAKVSLTTLLYVSPVQMIPS